MGKEELLEALTSLQDEASVESISRYISVVHEALVDIKRKRWRFYEDACSVILRQIWSLAAVDDEVIDEFENVQIKISTADAVDLSLVFIEPLIQATTAIADGSDDVQEVANQRGVLVAALLHLFAKIPGDLDVGDLRSRLVSDILACGVPVHVIFSTLRFREELVECRRALLPCHESDSETESEVNSDDEAMSFDESQEFDAEDSRWIVEQVATDWGLAIFQYFLQSSGQEYSFSSWSYRGIGNFTHALLLSDLKSHWHSLPAVVSPFSLLYQVTAFAHFMIHSEDFKERFRGLEIVRAATRYCPSGKLKIQAERELQGGTPQSFKQHIASFRARDWISPLIQVITNAMVSFPEPSDRSATLAVLKELIYTLEVEDRFWLLRSLILKCPYGNVAAALVDFVRGDTVKAWSSLEAQQLPFTTVEIGLLLQDVLSQAAERDLVLHADLIASCLSLQRFLFIRDKDNVTGIRTKSSNPSIWDVLLRIKKRLQLKTEETTSSHGSLSIDSDFTHLMILEAALGSALELYE